MDVKAVGFEFEELLRQNIMSSSFFIQKAEIELSDEDGKQRFFASIKFNIPDSFLISVRSTTGLEAARILVTEDTVLINDRINRTYFYGTPERAKIKYGISGILIPIFLGDVILNHLPEPAQRICERDSLSLDSFIDGNIVKYSINCGMHKTVSTTVFSEFNYKPVVFNFSEFEKQGDFIFARRVGIMNLNRADYIDIKFSKIIKPWDGSIVFVPGNNFERIEIK